jgi:sensor histidine kinase YesM
VRSPVNRSVLKWFARVIVIDAVVAVIVPIFQSFFDSHASFSGLLRQYFFAVIYSNLIGIPMCLILPAVWHRTSRLSPFSMSVIRAVIILLANFFGCLLAGLIMQAIVGPAYDYWLEFRSSFGISLVLSAIAVSFISTYQTQSSRLKDSAMQLKTKELERERALKLATEARLSSLEARIHPHFLFNTINSVSSLIHEDPTLFRRLRSEKVAPVGQLF